jgi:GT2 family glycosyltransferase
LERACLPRKGATSVVLRFRVVDASRIGLAVPLAPPTMTPFPAVAIVSVTFNRCEALLVLLSQLRTLDYPSERIKIFLVDNASADDTAARVRREFPEVRLTVSGENLGTSAGFNLGMIAALGDASAFEYVWLLDSDAEVEPGTLGPLVAAMNGDTRIGIVGSTIYDPSDRARLVTVGLRVNWDKGVVSLNKCPADQVGLVDTDLIPACSLLVRTSLCHDIGLWDERFWVYWGDTDWCQRALRRGYRVCGHTKSRAWHRDWANTARTFQGPSALYDELRGALLFNLRHAPEGSPRGVRRLVLKSFAKAALEHLTTRPFFSQAVEAAVDDALNGRFERKRYDPGYQLSAPVAIEDLCRRLKAQLPAHPSVVIAEIEDPLLVQRIKDAFASCCTGVRWEEITPRHREKRPDFTTDYRGFLRYDLRQLLARLVSKRADVVIADIAVPHLYTLVAAKRGILLERNGQAIALENQVGRGLLNVVKTLLRGIVVAYRHLPGALGGNPALRAAVTGDNPSPGPRPDALARTP